MNAALEADLVEAGAGVDNASGEAIQERRSLLKLAGIEITKDLSQFALPGRVVIRE